MQTLTLTHDEFGSTITFSRPERRNALSQEMIHELREALAECRHRVSRTLLLTGCGTAFCAGMDIQELQQARETDLEEYRRKSESLASLFRELYEFPAPTIAAVNGAAVGGGCGIALVCDFTLAAPAAKFGFPEVRLGFIPALVSVFLRRLVGEKRSRDLLLTGRLIDASTALSWGLITEVVEGDELLSRAQTLAAGLHVASYNSLRATKELLNLSADAPLTQALELASEANAQIRLTHDFQEGLAAFLEKRKAKFS